MSDYARVDMTGPAETLTLEPADTELLVTSLDALLEDLEHELKHVEDDDYAARLADRIDELAGLRDAIHSVVTDPGSDA